MKCPIPCPPSWKRAIENAKDDNRREALINAAQETSVYCQAELDGCRKALAETEREFVAGEISKKDYEYWRKHQQKVCRDRERRLSCALQREGKNHNARLL